MHLQLLESEMKPGQRITFSGQVENYKNTMSQVVELLGDENTTVDYLTRCIYAVGMGSNDYLNNYFMLATSRQYSPKQYAEDLIIRYWKQLNTLYNYGARKFALVGVGAIGCGPNALAQGRPDGTTFVECINSANQISTTGSSIWSNNSTTIILMQVCFQHLAS